MMQRDQNPSVELVIGERIVGAGGVAVAVDEGVMPHVLVTESAGLQDRTGGGADDCLSINSTSTGLCGDTVSPFKFPRM